jgi:hypothetical protein
MAAGLFRGIVGNLRAANPNPTWRSQWITSRREPLGKTRSAFNLRRLSLPKMLSGANAFEISDIERMNVGGHQPGV